MTLGGLAGAATAPLAPTATSRPASPAAMLAEPMLKSAFTQVEPEQIPRDVVASLVQDASGFIWIGTGDGPVRYDGHQLRPIERDDPDPARRNLGWVQAMWASADGTVWLGSEVAGLVRHNPLTDAVQGLGCGKPQGQACAVIRALTEDRQGHIWIGTAGDGLLKYSPGAGTFSPVAVAPAGGSVAVPAVRALLMDRSGSLWVGTSVGLFKRQAGQDNFAPVLAAVLAGQTVTALLQASDGQVWAGTQQGLLALVDPSTGQGRLLSDGAAGPNQVSRGQVSALAEAGAGQIWVGRSRGLDQWAMAPARLLRTLAFDPFEPGSIGGHEVSCLIRGRDGWLWVGSFGVGLQKLNPSNRAILLRAADRTRGNVLEEPDIRSLLLSRSGQVLAGTLAGDVAVLDAQWRIADEWRQPAQAEASKAQPAPSTITAMAQSASGELWLGADGRLLKLSPSGRVLARWPHAGGVPNKLFFSADGTLWMIAQAGLFRLRPGAGALSHVPAITVTGQPQPAAEMMSGLQTRDGRLWFGGHHGLYRFDVATDRLMAVASEPATKLVIGLLEDRDGSLWLDLAVTGLHWLKGWHGPKALLDPVSARHGIVNKPFGANLMQDALGRIWTHMHVYDPRTDRLTALGQADGVRFGTGRFHVHAQTADGTMVFGGSRGLLVVQPEAFHPDDTMPPLVAAGLKVNGQPRPVPDRPTRLILGTTERSFSLEFAALDYQNPQALRYRYRLNGLDSHWQETGASLRQAAYSNLAPGHYQLELQVAGPSGSWRGEPLLMPVEVLPAWWQTSGARLAAALLAIALVGLLTQWRTRTLRLRQVALELKVAERTQALQAVSAALEEASLSDPLTGLRNRRFLVRHMDAEIALLARCRAEARAQARTPGADASLVFFMIDIDHFKQVNDVHGHAAGDAVLLQVSERLQRVFRAEDYLVRWGGEEFLIVARHTEHDAAAELAERACRAVSEQDFDLGESRRLQRTCSVGFACFPLLAHDPQALGWHATVDLADAALYAAKQDGRNTWVGLRGVVGVDVDARSLQQMSERPMGERLRDPRWQVLRRPRPA